MIGSAVRWLTLTAARRDGRVAKRPGSRKIAMRGRPKVLETQRYSVPTCTNTRSRLNASVASPSIVSRSQRSADVPEHSGTREV